MSDAYIDGFVKTAIAFNVNPVELFRRARGFLPRISSAVRGTVGNKPVDAAIGGVKEFMRGRTMMLPLSMVPLATTAAVTP